MTYDVYRYIFIGAAILCGVMFAVSVLLFIFLKIPKVISDLTGATARKAIKQIREQNEASGDKGYKVSAFNEARGKLTDKISPSGNVIQQHRSQMPGINTSKIDTQELHVDEAANQTSVLDQMDGTTVLNQFEGTTVLGGENAGETAILSAPESPAGETSVLSTVEMDQAFRVEFEITYVHTNEVIV